MKLPGNLCEYDGKGHAFIYQNGSLSKFHLKTNETKWSIKCNITHSLKLDRVRSLLYFFEQEVFYRESLPFIGTVVKAVDTTNGNIVFNWKSSEHTEQLSEILLIPVGNLLPIATFPTEDALKLFPKNSRIFLDANQIDIVSENHPLLRFSKDVLPRDLLITAMDYSTLLRLRPKTKEVQSILRVPKSTGQIHTVSFTADDGLLVFINNSTYGKNFSVALKFKTPDLAEVLWQYPLEPSREFFSAYFSSVQEVSPELYLVTDNTDGKESYQFIDEHSKIVKKIPSARNRKIYKAFAIHKDSLIDFLGVDLRIEDLSN